MNVFFNISKDLLYTSFLSYELVILRIFFIINNRIF